MALLCGHLIPWGISPCWNPFSVELPDGSRVDMILHGVRMLMIACLLQELRLPSLLLRRQYQNIVMVRSIMQRQTAINFDDCFKLMTNFKRSHPLTLQIQSSSINALRYSFYGSTFYFVHGFVAIYLINFFCFCLCVCVVFVFVSRDHLVQALPFVYP